MFGIYLCRLVAGFILLLPCSILAAEVDRPYDRSWAHVCRWNYTIDFYHGDQIVWSLDDFITAYHGTDDPHGSCRIVWIDANGRRTETYLHKGLLVWWMGEWVPFIKDGQVRFPYPKRR